MRSVPEARERVERGELALSNAAAVERFIRREEKETGKRLAPEAKRELVIEIAGKSARETERLLAARAQAAGMAPRPERARALGAEYTELRLVADGALMSRIERIKELKGTHLALAEIFSKALDAYLDREDPLRRPGRRAGAGVPSEGGQGEAGIPTSEVRCAKGRYLPVDVRRAVAARSGGRCEYKDAKTGRRCEGRAGLKWDHVRPYALGGPATVANIRQLCPAHQQWAAIRALGSRVMGRYLKTP